MASVKQLNKPPIRAVPMGLFPTLDSLDEVMTMAKATHVNTQASSNQIVSLLMTYHNTLLKVLNTSTH